MHLRDPAEQEDADKNSICGLEISFTSLPQDIDIKLITEAGEAAAAAE